VSDEQTEETGIDFDYIIDGDKPQTVVIIKDESKFRNVVEASIQWVPAIHGEGGEYPGADEMDRLEKEGKSEEVPIMVIKHSPSHGDPDEAMEHIETQLYQIGPDNVVNLIGTGINMFTQDAEMTTAIMKGLLLLLFTNQHDHEDGETPVSDESVEDVLKGFEEHLREQEGDRDQG
jgi:hypothetical protein